jgi:hypothetical protein
MILRAIRILFVLAGSLCAAGCAFFSQSAFPQSLTQVIARQDLSSDISPSASQGFNLFAVEAGGFQYVLLFTDSSADNGRPHLIVMSSQLDVLNRFSLGDLNTLGGPFHGSIALKDCNDRVAVGNFLFDPSAGGLSFFGTHPWDLRQPTMMVMTVPGSPWIEGNFRTSAGTLVYDEYDSGWTDTFTPSGFLIGTPTPPPSSPLQVAAAFTDPDSLTADVVLVFSDGPSDRQYFPPVLKTDIDLPFPGLGAGSIFGSYPVYAVKTNLASSSIGYSRQGMVVYDFQSGALKRFTLGSPAAEVSMSFGRWKEGMRLACQLSGESVYVWDPSECTVTRYARWW